MNLLIVEDDENKRQQILRFIEQTYPSLNIKTARSLQSGLDVVCDDTPDLVLLDMTIPNYDTGPEESGGYMYKTGGWEFLRQMDRFEIDIPVIVVTQFEKFGESMDSIDLAELDRKLRDEHGHLYLGYVYYNAAISGWQANLGQLVTRAIELVEKRGHASDSNR